METFDAPTRPRAERPALRFVSAAHRTRGASLMAPVIAVALLAALLAASGCAAWRIGESAALAQRSEPLQRRPEAPSLRMLVVGDSTGVGTGASAPERSLPGLIAAAHPRLAIDNRASDGAKFEDVAAQLDQAGARYDVVLVLAGGNDVIRLRDLDRLREDIGRVAARAREHADLVVLMPAGNVGNAPFFFPPLSWWMSQRARVMHGQVREAAAHHGAVYVRLFEEREDDPFVRHPELNASDGLHPSDAGYARWYAALREQAPVLMQRLAAARAR